MFGVCYHTLWLFHVLTLCVAHGHERVTHKRFTFTASRPLASGPAAAGRWQLTGSAFAVTDSRLLRSLAPASPRRAPLLPKPVSLSCYSQRGVSRTPEVALDCINDAVVSLRRQGLYALVQNASSTGPHTRTVPESESALTHSACPRGGAMKVRPKGAHDFTARAQ